MSTARIARVTRIAQARDEHAEWHNKFMKHQAGCPKFQAGQYCLICRTLDANADAAGTRWAVLEGVER